MPVLPMLAGIQEALVHLSGENIVSIKELIENDLFKTKSVDVAQIVHMFFVASECQVRRTLFLCNLMCEIIREHPETHNLFKHELLHSFAEPPVVHRMRCFFLRQLMLKEIITSFEVVKSIRDFFEGRPSNPERVFVSFCWFAPEIEQHDKLLFEILERTMNRNFQTGFIAETFRNFVSLVDQLKANDWALFRTCTDIGFNPDHYALVVARDDVSALQASADLDPNYRLPACIFNCAQILDSKPYLLHVAAYFGAVKCFDYLLTQGADPTACDNKNVSLVGFAVAGGSGDIIQKLLGMPGIRWNGAFEYSAKHHCNELFYYFEKNRPSGLASSDAYADAICCCAESNNLSLLVKCIEVCGADPASLTAAAKNGHPDAIKLLLDADQGPISEGEMSPLDWAISSDNLNCVKAVLSNQTILYSEEEKAESMALAVSRGRPDITKYMLDMKFFDSVDANGMTPLHVACNYEALSVIDMLLEDPTLDINKQDDEGCTALHHATASGYLGVVRKLVEHPNINLSIKDEANATPLDWANAWDQPEIAQLLREHGAVKSDSVMLHFDGPKTTESECDSHCH